MFVYENCCYIGMRVRMCKLWNTHTRIIPALPSKLSFLIICNMLLTNHHPDHDLLWFPTKRVEGRGDDMCRQPSCSVTHSNILDLSLHEVHTHFLSDHRWSKRWSWRERLIQSWKISPDISSGLTCRFFGFHITIRRRIIISPHDLLTYTMQDGKEGERKTRR